MRANYTFDQRTNLFKKYWLPKSKQGPDYVEPYHHINVCKSKEEVDKVMEGM